MVRVACAVDPVDLHPLHGTRHGHAPERGKGRGYRYLLRVGLTGRDGADAHGIACGGGNDRGT